MFSIGLAYRRAGIAGTWIVSLFLSMNGLTTRLSGKEIAKHNSRESCWIIVHGAVRSP